MASDFEAGLVLDLVAAQLLADGTCLSGLAASEEAERRYIPVINSIDKIIASEAERGVTSRYVWEEGPESGRLVNRRVISSQTEAARLELRDQIIVQMEAGLFADPKDFELAAGHLLDVYGALPHDRGVTRYVGDKGFDFFGVVRTDSPTGSMRLRGQPWRIVGQAKRYAATVSCDEIDTFGARVAAVRHGNPALLSPFSTGFRANPSPILGLYVTTGTFQSGAIDAARRHLIVTLDRLQVAEDLAASPAATRWVDSSGDLIPERFVSFLRTRPGMASA